MMMVIMIMIVCTYIYIYILGMYYLQRNDVQPVPQCSLGDLGPGGAQRRAEARNRCDALGSMDGIPGQATDA